MRVCVCFEQVRADQDIRGLPSASGTASALPCDESRRVSRHWRGLKSFFPLSSFFFFRAPAVQEEKKRCGRVGSAAPEPAASTAAAPEPGSPSSDLQCLLHRVYSCFCCSCSRRPRTRRKPTVSVPLLPCQRAPTPNTRPGIATPIVILILFLFFLLVTPDRRLQKRNLEMHSRKGHRKYPKLLGFHPLQQITNLEL